MYETIPDEMKQCKNWVCFRLEERNGRWTKKPIDPHTGNLAKSNDPATWAPFDLAAKVQQASHFDGVGFMLSHSPYVGVDLDHCLQEGAFSETAARILELADSYAEISPSGAGVHILIRGDIPDGRGRRNKEIEIYPAGRYLTMTGDTLPGHETIRENQPAIDAILAEIDGARTAGPAAGGGECPQEEGEPRPAAPVDMDDAALIEKIRKSRQGAKFAALYDAGDTSAYGGDTSAADMALMNILAFWTRCDGARMERIFSASALGQRKKWKEREDYRAWTINRAKTDATAVYTGPDTARDGARAAGHIEAAYTDKGMAERLVMLYGDILKYCPDVKSWYRYNGILWERIKEEVMYSYLYAMLKEARADMEAEFQQKIDAGTFDKTEEERRDKLRKYLTSRENYNPSTAIIKTARAMRLADIADFDADPWRINCMNGTLDLKTGKVSEHRAGDLFTKSTAADYLPGCRCPLWEETVARILPDADTRQWMQKFIGYCLTGSVREEKFLFLYGPGGRGKGTFIETIAAAMGDYAETIPIDILLARRNDAGSGNEATPELAKLAGVRLAVTSEAGSGRRFNDAKLKLITGGDRITARALRCDPFTYSPQFKLIASSNYMPAVTDITDEGIRRRLVIVPFEADIQSIRDLTLKERLRAPDVLAGVLAWAVEGCRLWQAEGLEPIPRAVRERLFSYYEDNDEVGDFIAERCDVDPAAATPVRELYEDFLQWDGNGRRYASISKKAFSQTLARRGFPQQRTRQARIICGLRLRAWHEDFPGGA